MDLKLNLFKIACLKYEANPVTYQGKQIERKELLSLQKVITDLAVQRMEQVKEKIKHVYDLTGTANRSERPDSPERTDAKDDSAP